MLPPSSSSSMHSLTVVVVVIVVVVQPWPIISSPTFSCAPFKPSPPRPHPQHESYVSSRAPLLSHTNPPAPPVSLTLLTAPPPALTPSELAEISAATPASFEGIAPLLRHLENEVDFTIEPAVGGFGGGKGELFITEG
jgi:hypothetical protein